MIDREKVIKGLEICTTRPCYCTDCPYKKDCVLDSQEVMEDALALLKEREAVELVKWIYPTDIIGFGRCPHCNSLWDYSLISNRFFKHCPRCGQAVKWE